MSSSAGFRRDREVPLVDRHLEVLGDALVVRRGCPPVSRSGSGPASSGSPPSLYPGRSRRRFMAMWRHRSSELNEGCPERQPAKRPASPPSRQTPRRGAPTLESLGNQPKCLLAHEGQKTATPVGSKPSASSVRTPVQPLAPLITQTGARPAPQHTARRHSSPSQIGRSVYPPPPREANTSGMSPYE